MVSSDVEHGSLTCGASVQSVTVENLIPKQDYVAYFVIKGTSQIYSPVYCYRFTTGDVIKPYITMQELSPNVAFKTSEDSNLNYALFAGAELPSEFNRPFREYVDESKKNAFDKEAGQEAATMTVLNAIMRTRTDGYSWFDLYAEPPAKAGGGIRKTIEEIILRGQGSGGSPGVAGQAETKAGKEIRRDFTDDMDPQSATNYYCIAAAKNVLGGEYAFKAVSNVHIPDKTPPVLYAPTANGIKQSNETFKGDLTLNFSENLYWIGEDRNAQKRCAVLNKNKDESEVEATVNPDGTVTPGEKILIKHMGGNGVLKLTPMIKPTPSSSFTFSYKGVHIGDTLTLFDDGFISDARGNSTQSKIILEYQATKTGLNDALAGGWVIVSQ